MRLKEVTLDLAWQQPATTCKPDSFVCKWPILPSRAGYNLVALDMAARQLVIEFIKQLHMH
jgi:hypothetical protein